MQVWTWAKRWAAVGGMLMVTTVCAGTLSGSAHDFPVGGGGLRGACVVCHPLQQSDGARAQVPAWDHHTPLMPFTVYSGLDLLGESRPRGSSSKICLSCHDGVVARDSFGGMRPSPDGFEWLSGSASMPGRRGSEDHPIGLPYSNESDPSLHSTDRRVVIGSGSASREGTLGSLMLRGGSMECTSCHDAHNTLAADGPGMVKLPATGAAICLACHRK